jgi:hypothetical protein
MRCFSEDYQMKVQPTTKELIAMLYERLPELFDRAAAQPAVPDAFGTREGEHPQYIQGWNDCRAEMLKGKP